MSENILREHIRQSVEKVWQQVRTARSGRAADGRRDIEFCKIIYFRFQMSISQNTKKEPQTLTVLAEVDAIDIADLVLRNDALLEFHGS